MPQPHFLVICLSALLVGLYLGWRHRFETILILSGVLAVICLGMGLTLPNLIQAGLLIFVIQAGYLISAVIFGAKRAGSSHVAGAEAFREQGAGPKGKSLA